jgi:hypothetical protein
MVNTKPVGVAYSDPQLVSGTTIDGAVITNPTITGASITGAVTASTLNIAVAKPAAAGTNQATGTALGAGFSWVTGADATKGVALPTGVAGLVVIVKNDDTANAVLKVYSANDGNSAAINAVASGTAYSMAAKTSCMFVAYSATQWFSIPLVAS